MKESIPVVVSKATRREICEFRLINIVKLLQSFKGPLISTKSYTLSTQSIACFTHTRKAQERISDILLRLLNSII